MSPRTIAQLLGVTRLIVGIGMVASPGAMRGTLGELVDTPGGHVAVRALGGRDIWLGALTFYAVRQDKPGRWVAALGYSDLADACAMALMGGRLPPRTVAGGVLGGLVPAVASIVAGSRME